MRPVVCMVTDRLRFGDDVERRVVQRVKAAAAAGVDLVQIRERDMEGRQLAHLVSRCVEAVTGTRTRVLVNDRLDVALASGAHGVHLRSDSMPADRARASTPPGFLIGRSVHAVDEAVRVSASGAVDYLLFGTVFETRSKPGQRAAGPAMLAHVAGATTTPVLAVGGVTSETLEELAATGAAGFAAIGLFADAGERDLATIVSQATRAFQRG